MTDFHNPYHFVPYKEQCDNKKKNWLDIDDFRERKLEHRTHSRYLSGKDIFHGRLVCRLTTESPIFIGGAEREKSDETTIGTCFPFKIDRERAIPASTLRGLISSIVEAASNSSLRVLEDRSLSCRKAMNGALGGIGLLQKDKEDGKLKLLPLTLPVYPFRFQKKAKGGKWWKIFPSPALPIHLKGYRNAMPRDFLRRKNPMSFSNTVQEYWYMQLESVNWSSYNPNATLEITGKPAELNDPITEAEYQDLPSKEKGCYSRGILRVLGIEGREGEIPSGKKKELFLPFPEKPVNNLLPIDTPLAVFEKLARDRAKKDKKYPFLPRGRQPEEVKDFSLKENDLVYFDINDDGKVTELAVASIWRQNLGMLFDFISDKELLPFNVNREKISPAELLFGFTEQRDKEEKLDDFALSFASRLRFSYGQLAEEWRKKGILDDVVSLKILDTPKPPSPALYFTSKIECNNNNSIFKNSLNPKDHKLQGRKFYLHHCEEKQPDEFWKTNNDRERTKQKIKIQPIKSGVSFCFHIDFDNLSRYELGMLLYALSPAPSFRHKIGMGKPLGLGTIHIEPLEFQQLDRMKRYCEDDIFSPKSRYNPSINFQDNSELKTIRDDFIKSIPKETHNAIILIGNPEKVNYPVHYPLQENQKYEEEGFKWFVQNDKETKKRQQLHPIKEDTKELPKLNRN